VFSILCWEELLDCGYGISQAVLSLVGYGTLTISKTNACKRVDYSHLFKISGKSQKKMNFEKNG
jgi:hypothetical protein